LQEAFYLPALSPAMVEFIVKVGVVLRVKGKSINKTQIKHVLHLPNKVIKFGSPPKALALSLSHRIASA
jgi:hypothetical protein